MTPTNELKPHRYGSKTDRLTTAGAHSQRQAQLPHVSTHSDPTKARKRQIAEYERRLSGQIAQHGWEQIIHFGASS
jgi:hypothetical protein